MHGLWGCDVPFVLCMLVLCEAGRFVQVME